MPKTTNEGLAQTGSRSNKNEKISFYNEVKIYKCSNKKNPELFRNSIPFTKVNVSKCIRLDSDQISKAQISGWLLSL